MFKKTIECATINKMVKGLNHEMAKLRVTVNNKLKRVSVYKKKTIIVR